jgi:hypothetical protein|tara:strand:+ start:408 stop:524 length:117 start_codon:yes stop_codon:yes gene_type:complete
MINKIILLTVFFLILISCGKKTDPEYKTKTNNALISKV